MEEQFLWMVSSVRRRISKGCLALVEGTWFDGMCELSELSSAKDDVTSERFGLQRGAATQLEARWSTTSARAKTALQPRSAHQTSPWERLSRPPRKQQLRPPRSWHKLLMNTMSHACFQRLHGLRTGAHACLISTAQFQVQMLVQ